MEFFDKPTHHAGGEAQLVELDPDHPGFKDQAYMRDATRLHKRAISKPALESDGRLQSRRTQGLANHR